jgi:hypothetical protein
MEPRAILKKMFVPTDFQGSVEELNVKDLAELLVSLKECLNTAELMYRKAEAEMLQRVGRGAFIAVPMTFMLGDEELNKGIEIRHKSKERLTYNDGQVIRFLKDAHLEGDYITTETVTMENLDREKFESDLPIREALTNLRPLAVKKESDWLEIRGLPK